MIFKNGGRAALSGLLRRDLPLLALGACLAGQAAQADTLGEAVLEAYRHNPTLAAQRAESRAIDENVKQAKSAFGPTLSGSASYDYTKNRLADNVTSTSREGWGTSFSVRASQPLFTSGRLGADLIQARRVSDAGKENLRGIEMRVLASVVSAYVAVRRDADLVAIARRNVELLREQADQIQTRLRYRDVTQTDLDQTNTRLELGLAQLRVSEGNLEASRDAYRNVVGHYPQMPLAPLPVLPPLPAAIDQAYETGELKNPDYQVAVLNEQASRAELASARAELGPSVSLVGGVARSPAGQNFSDEVRSTTLSGGVTLSMPLYTSGFLSSRIRQALERNERDIYRVEQSRRDMRQSIAQGWDLLNATRRALPHYRDAVKAAENAVAGGQRQLQAGQITALDVLDSARDLLQAGQTATQVEANAYTTHVGLLQAMGVLDVSTFTEPGTVYDADAYGRRVGGWTGLPTGPIVELVDSVLVRLGRTMPNVQVESDHEAKDMAPAP